MSSETGGEPVESDEAAEAPPAAPAEEEMAEEEVPIVVFDSAALPMTEPTETGDELVVPPESIDYPAVPEGAETNPSDLEVASAETVKSADAVEPAEVEPAPPPLPDPLDSREINRLIFAHIGPGLLPVHRSGSALYILHDLDGNGYNDVFALAVRGEKQEIAEFANIHDYTRLYSADRVAVKFYLRLFYQRNGTLETGDLVSLGERIVVDSFTPQALIAGKQSPFVVSIVFTTRQGRVREWVIFAGGKPSRFSMQERTGELPRIEDIDGDGVIDVVMYEEDYEAGIGNETYMTWYAWNGTDFVRKATANVVRSLQAFLADVFAQICSENWSGFADTALAGPFLDGLSADERKGFPAFNRIFGLAAAGEAFRNAEIGPEEDIRRAVYPEIRENPFSQRDEDGFFFPLTVRFETDSGRNHLYTARVYMLANPFGPRQFSFGLLPE